MADESFDWSECLAHVASSDVGMRRSNNQDSYGVALATDLDDWYERGHLFVVADGMGAHAAGELASKLAVDHVIHIYRKSDQLSPPEALEKAIRESNEEIHRKGEANLDFHNMGTTCSALLLLPQGAVAGHVGDSRIYRLRGQDLGQLTFDHSLVWEMREAGQLSSADESQVPKNVITRSLGPQPSVKVDLEGPFPIEVGDIFLICSDGLTGRVEDVEIGAALASLPVEDANRLLINLANLRGGPDNITIVTAKVTAELMETKASQIAPLTLGQANDVRPPLHLAWWISLGVSGLLAGAMAATGGLNLAAIPAAVFVILLVVILLQRSDLFGSDSVRLAGGRRLGKGPYRTCKSKSPKDFARNLLSAIETGRKTAESRGWETDWTDFDKHFDAARQSIDDHQYQQALKDLDVASTLLAGLFQQEMRSAI